MIRTRPRVQMVLSCSLACGGGTSQERPPPKTTPAAPSGSAADSPQTLVAPQQPLTPAATASNCAIDLTADVPPDAEIASQVDADCFAWREFVALNRPADKSAPFGAPGDRQPVVWQGFMSTQQVFQPDGSSPPPWGTAPAIPKGCLTEAGLTKAAARGVSPLSMPRKFSTLFEPGDQAEAAPFNAPAWLGDVNGNNVWYEIRLSKDEYDTIVQLGLYSQQGQKQWYANHPGQALALPMGSFRPTSTVGSVEIKAAWMIVPDATDAKWQRYKLTDAITVDPATQKCRSITVALVGLHIIHKTASQPTWVWATFEHIDNAPNDGDAGSAGAKAWNFFDPACHPRTVEVKAAQCQHKGAASVVVGCTPNTPPPYFIGDGCPAPVPIQVTRVLPIDPLAQSVTERAQQAITAAYPNSVWQNYQLIDVIWSTNPPPSQQPKVPQVFDSPLPARSVANAVLETYVQTSQCIDCHKAASISGDSNLPADFSFALGEAQPVPGTAAAAKLAAVESSHPLFRRIAR